MSDKNKEVVNNETFDILIEGEKKNIKPFLIIGVVLLIVLVIIFGFLLLKHNYIPDEKHENEVQNDTKYLGIRIKDNSLQDFDLSFLKMENKKINKVYSPLSIKYALAMLEEGANGNSKEQISNVLGEYTSKKYVNSKNMSFSNALFIKDNYKDSVKNSYIDSLKNKFNASILFDSFTSPAVVNSWVKSNTFELIDNLFEDISDFDFILTNALAIDMEWVNELQNEYDDYIVEFLHREYSKSISALNDEGGYYYQLGFKDVDYDSMSVEIGAVANRYDIISDLGEENIRMTVSAEYQKWLDNGGCGDISIEPDVSTYLNTYIREIGEGYNTVNGSTDFEFYINNDVKVFAKDLKKYDGITLQYIGIMPTEIDLNKYIDDVDANKINSLINSLKPLEKDSFKDGVITEIYGYIPMFKMDYELDFIKDLKRLGITDVFDSSKADLSNLTSSDAFITDAKHKANIEFSNKGIKAAAATAVGGKGAADCKFDYIYDVPVEKIDMTFDKPYLFLIRDKESGEIWFSGTVYEPLKWVEPANPADL